MPNSRRRKFSVRNGITGKQTSNKPQNHKNELQISDPDMEAEMHVLANNVAALKCSSKTIHYNFNALEPDSEKKPTNDSTDAIKCTKSKNKIIISSSNNSNNEDFISECESSSSKITVKNTLDKDVTASSSNIDFFNVMYSSVEWTEPWKTYDKTELPPKERRERITRTMTRDRTPLKREKYLRQHRIKVRSPKRRIGLGISDTQSKTNDVDKPIFNFGTDAIDWAREAEMCDDSSANVVETIDDDERQSDHSSDDMCRICHGGDSLSQELGQLISACACRGTVGRVHVKCLERWLTESGKSRCELCGTRYVTRRIHRYGVPRALVMWVLSQNAKQLMVDSLGIMLMSPLAVLAAWLSGRTLAGLMTQDSHTTPWPLASTFVLACMTLVCYYCWIVSAATRHALGWWIWYRSQYEVRLQIMESDE